MNSESSHKLLYNFPDQPSDEVMVNQSIHDHFKANYDDLSRHIKSPYGFDSYESIPSLDVFLYLIKIRNYYREEIKSPFLFCLDGYDDDKTVIHSFLWDGIDIFFMSNRINGVGAHSQSRRAIKLVDLTMRDVHFDYYNVLLPQFPAEYSLLLQDYQSSETNANFLGTFSETRLLMLDQSNESGAAIVPVLLEKSSNGWLTLAGFLEDNYDEPAFYIAAMQGLLCLLIFQENQIDFGDLSANNVIIFPGACGYVPIDLSTLQFSEEVMAIPAPISTFFDPELGPYRRAPQVDRFSLVMNMLFVSVHLARHHDVKQAILSMTALCQSGVFLGSQGDNNLPVLAQYKASYHHLSTIIKDNVDLPQLFEILLQLVHPDSHERPSLRDIFNRVEIARLAITSIKKQVLVDYSLSKNIEISNDLNHLMIGTGLDENEKTENIEEYQSPGRISGVLFLSLLIYCCHNCDTDPSAIRDQMNKLIDLVRSVDHQLLDIHSAMIHRYESRFPGSFILEQIMRTMVDEVSHDIATDVLQADISSDFKTHQKDTESPTTVHTFFTALSDDKDKVGIVTQAVDDITNLTV